MSIRPAPKRQRIYVPNFRLWISWDACCACYPSSRQGDPDQMSQRRVQSEAAHVHSRGAGGDDVANLIPLDHWHHIDVQHLRGWNALWAAHPTDGLEHATYLAERYWHIYHVWRDKQPRTVAPAF